MLSVAPMRRVASGPQNPWEREACGSLSSKRTRWPALANVPARWWQVDVFPTPPFWFRRLIVIPMRRSFGRGSCSTVKRAHHGYRPRGRSTVKQTGTYTTEGSAEDGVSFVPTDRGIHLPPAPLRLDDRRDGVDRRERPGRLPGRRVER